MWKPIICFVLCIFIAAGCSFPHREKKAENAGADQIKYQRLSSDSSDHNQEKVDLSGQTQTLGTEVNTAKKIMRSYKEYKLVSVSINGSNMWVTAHTRESMSVHERMKREANVQKKLKKALPQYKINVKLEEK